MTRQVLLTPDVFVNRELLAAVRRLPNVPDGISHSVLYNVLRVLGFNKVVGQHIASQACVAAGAVHVSWLCRLPSHQNVYCWDESSWCERHGLLRTVWTSRICSRFFQRYPSDAFFAYIN